MYSHQLLIKDLLLTPVVNNPEQEIVYKDLYRFTYRDFHAQVKQLANVLVELGVKKGDTVAVMDYDSHRYLALYFAVPMIGAVLHTINVKLAPEQILYTIEHAEDDVLFVHRDFFSIIENIGGRIGTINQYIGLVDEGELPKTSINLAGEYESLLANVSAEFDFETFDENTRATMFYTTGTTGMPKGVYYSHRQLVLHTLGGIASLSTANTQNLHREDVYMPITPMFHVHAWGLPYVATFLGVKQVYPGKYVPENLLDLISREGVTFSHCVPTILHMLFNARNINDVDLSRWKVIIGGAALPKSLCKAALARGIDVFTGYGMSETCPILTLAQLTPEALNAMPDDQVDIRVKTGKALGMVELQIVDDEGQPVPNDGESVGELVARSPWLTQGYFKDKKNSEKLWKGGYLHTGDVAHKSADGYYKITDRAKDIIKVSGEWVSSLELEDIIAQHKDVEEVAVISQPHDKWTEVPLALVVSKAPSAGLEKVILNHVRDFIHKGILARESMLINIRFIDSIDKTSVGKIDKKSLRSKYVS